MTAIPRWASKKDPVHWNHQVIMWIDGNGPYIWGRYVKKRQAKRERALLRMYKGTKVTIEGTGDAKTREENHE